MTHWVILVMEEKREKNLGVELLNEVLDDNQYTLLLGDRIT